MEFVQGPTSTSLFDKHQHDWKINSKDYSRNMDSKFTIVFFFFELEAIDNGYKTYEIKDFVCSLQFHFAMNKRNL